ncbi:MAG TPA: hypothetical protein VF024_13695 [Solirubrobacteraceae bacterium]
MPTFRVVAGLAAAMALGLPAAAVANTWSGPTRIPGHTGLTVPHAAMDAAGEAVVIWSDGNGHVYASIRSAAGRFSAPQTLVSGPDGTAVRAEQLAVGRDGTAVVVWAQAARRSPHYRVMASVRRPHERFGPARMVGAAQSVFRSNPNAAVSSHGTIAVVWSRDDAPRIAMAVRGGRFGASRALRGWGAQVVVAFAADDRLYAAFSALRSPSGAGTTPSRSLYATSTAVPPRFAAPRRVAVNGLDPALAAGPSRTMTLAWRTGAVDTSEGLGAGAIYAARSSRGGPFRGAAAVSPAGITGRSPVAAGSPLGVLVTWDKFGGIWPTDPPGAGPVYSWVADRASGPWRPAQPLAGPADWTTVPGMAIDSSGLATVAYMRRTSSTTRSLAVRTGPIGAPLGDEQILAQAEDRHNAHNAWWQAAVASSGRTTLVVWATPVGGKLIAFTSTGS